MTEDEYMAGEPDDEDEILYDFLIEEEEDIDVILLPKFEFDLEGTLDSYYMQIKRCRNKDQIIAILQNFYAHISGTILLQNDINYLQDRAKEIELNIKIMQDKLF